MFQLSFDKSAICNALGINSQLKLFFLFFLSISRDDLIVFIDTEIYNECRSSPFQRDKVQLSLALVRNLSGNVKAHAHRALDHVVKI